MRGTLRSGNTEPGSILVGNTVPIDLRHRPTRAELGVRPGRNDRSYQQAPGGPELDVAIELPTGSLRIPAFVVSVSGGDDTPAGRANPREPALILVERLCSDAGAARAALAEDAPILGLAEPDVDALATRLTDVPGPLGPRQDNRYGLVADWLSVEIGVIGRADGQVQVNYGFGIDRFHHPALDRVVRDGVFHLDLTRPPTRAELGFRDTYSVAALQSPPGADLIALVTLPGGVLHRPVAAVRSTTTGPDRTDPTGVGEPVRTDLVLPTSGVVDAERILLADAAALGLEPGAAAAAFAKAPGPRTTTTLAGQRTDIGAIEVRVDASPDRTDDFAASLTYTFHYRPDSK